MILLIDECVPASVTQFFRERGHVVHLVTELFGAGSPDPLIAVGGDKLSAILVTWNHRDFKQVTARVPDGNVLKFRHLGRISFRVNPAHGRRRAEELIEWIEFEYGQVQGRRDKRLLVEITETRFNVIR
jgi:hypothetical protein